MSARVRCMLVDAAGGAVVTLRPETVLDELAELHRLAPRATIEVIELEEELEQGPYWRPTWTPVGWIWRPRPRMHRLAKGARPLEQTAASKRPAR